MRSLVRHCVFLLAASHAAAAESAHLLENEVVARVNTQAISLRDVETRMVNSGPAMLRLFLLRETLRAEGQWDEPQQKRFDEVYLPAFREELGRAIREELMRQDARRQGLEVDRAVFEQHLRRLLDEYRAKDLLGADGHSLEQIQRDLPLSFFFPDEPEAP